MSVLSANAKVTARTGTYNVTVSSVDSDKPVSFQIGKEAYDPLRVEDSAEISSSGGTPSPTSSDVSIVIHPTDPSPTKWNQNPIKLVVQSVTSDQGEYTGNSAVFYGYFLASNGGGLNFYLNQEQSQAGFQYGQAGVPANINLSQIAVG